tara:strand:+ start:63 stop:404 length:342 start_codon:yes stop_codon:yes gene_type:complete
MTDSSSLSSLTKKDLLTKCLEYKASLDEFSKFKNQIQEYKAQLEVRANYIQQLQIERDQLLEKAENNIMPSPHEILQDYKAKLYKDKTNAEEFLKTKADKCKMVEDLLNNLGS